MAENYRVSGAIQFELKWKLYKEFNVLEKQLFAPGENSLTGNDRFSGDFNGDGLSDFLIFHRDRGEWILGETGDGTIRFRVFSRTPEFRDVTRWLQGDFNGDGRTDIGFYSKTDNNFWVGEATPDGFRYKVYNNLANGPDPARVMATPLPRDEVQVKDVKAVVASETKTTLLDYQYDGNYHTGRGEKAFPGYFTNAGTTAELLIFNKKDGRLYLKQGGSEPAFKLGLDLYGEGVTILNGEKPDRYRAGRDGILYYKKTSSMFGSDAHSFNVVYAPSGSGFTDLPIASFTSSAVSDFNISQSVYLVDRFMSNSEDKHILILDDLASTPRFVLMTGTGTGQTMNLSVGGSALDAEYFANIRERKNRFQFFSGRFISGTAQVLIADMTSGAHQWYLGSISGNTISFSRLSGTPSFHKNGYLDSYRVVGSGSGAELVYGTVEEGYVTFNKLILGASSISHIRYATLAKGTSFNGEFDNADNPVVYVDNEAKRAVLQSTCRLETLTASALTMKRPDLLTQVYPFQWIQGDYNGDGKTDIGIFHMKESHWYFALTQGTVPDLMSVVKNGIGGTYHLTYENSTRFDNTDDDGVPRLPMNYKVCTAIAIQDGGGQEHSHEL